MKKYLFPLVAVTLCTLVAACGGEDDLEPTYADDNRFVAADSLTNPVSALRSEFYRETGSYLLFNDTLRHDSIGIDANGHTVYATELLDVSYNMTSNGTETAFKYDYLTRLSDMQRGVDFLKGYVLPHLGTKLKPFSWLLVNHITRYTVTDGVYAYDAEPQFAVGPRATALAIEGLQDMDADSQKDYAATVLVDLMGSRMAALSAATLSPFTQYANGLYEKNVDNPHYDNEGNLEDMHQAGFLDGYYTWGFLIWGKYPAQSDDIVAFVKLVLTQSAEEVSETYADYPTIISKYNAMRALLVSLGYVF